MSDVSRKQTNFMSRQRGGGNNLSDREFEQIHHKALGDGLRAGSKNYFSAASKHADSMAAAKRSKGATDFESLRKNASSNYFPKK